MKNPDPSSFLVCSIFLLWYDGIAIKKRADVFEAKGVRMTRKSIIEGEDEYNACIAALKTWNTRHADKEA